MKIIDTIGNTPLVRLKSGIFAKLEYFNPTGSIKDRTALSMLTDAKKKNILSDKGIVEPTSGNTGISLAFLGAYFNIPVKIVMPENMSRQRIKIMKSFGADVVLTDKEKGMQGSIDLANEFAQEGYIMLDQFSNPSNPYVHEHTTAEEIMHDLGRVDIFAACVGTGGTFSGIARRLKRANSDILTVAIEPALSAVLSGKSPGTHSIQGIGAGFVPKVMDVSLIDEIITVSDNDAISYMNKLISEDGVFSGISSGAAVYAALDIKKRFPQKNIVTIIADSADRYI